MTVSAGSSVLVNQFDLFKIPLLARSSEPPIIPWQIPEREPYGRALGKAADGSPLVGEGEIEAPLNRAKG
jgi:hypothetical protein